MLLQMVVLMISSSVWSQKLRENTWILWFGLEIMLSFCLSANCLALRTTISRELWLNRPYGWWNKHQIWVAFFLENLSLHSLMSMLNQIIHQLEVYKLILVKKSNSFSNYRLLNTLRLMNSSSIQGPSLTSMLTKRTLSTKLKKVQISIASKNFTLIKVWRSIMQDMINTWRATVISCNQMQGEHWPKQTSRKAETLCWKWLQIIRKIWQERMNLVLLMSFSIRICTRRSLRLLLTPMLCLIPREYLH